MRPPARDNDAWLRALASPGPDGDEARRALRALIVRGLGRVLATRGGSSDLCEDYAQEAMVRIAARLASFRGESRFTTWALAIATRVAFDDLRHKRWQDVSLDAITGDAGAPVELAPPDGELPEDRRLARERVGRALAEVIEGELTERQRVVLAAELEGMPHVELAARLGINRNALYKLAHDARKRVKARLVAAGISEADVRWAYE